MVWDVFSWYALGPLICLETSLIGGCYKSTHPSGSFAFSHDSRALRQVWPLSAWQCASTQFKPPVFGWTSIPQSLASWPGLSIHWIWTPLNTCGMQYVPRIHHQQILQNWRINFRRHRAYCTHSTSENLGVHALLCCCNYPIERRSYIVLDRYPSCCFFGTWV